MNIILVRNKSGIIGNINLSRHFIIVLFLLFLGLPVASYYFGMLSVSSRLVMADITNVEHIEPIRKELNKVIGSIYKDKLAQQQEELIKIRLYNQDNIDELTHELAKLQAHIIRLDFLGERLIDVAKLDKKAFNFELEPAIGGAADVADMEQNSDFDNIKHTEFTKRMQQITRDIEDKSKQLSILETLLIAEQARLTSTPRGKPAEKGWISSHFGWRKDPFTGKKKQHKGVDLAGQPGSSILATADGVVVLSEKQDGYGDVMEIDHGYGIRTRYGHNKAILVAVGDIVKQGQVIATMGSSGRSTGPHVHYEVLLNGQQVNPKKYITIAKK